MPLGTPRVWRVQPSGIGLAYDEDMPNYSTEASSTEASVFIEAERMIDSDAEMDRLIVRVSKARNLKRWPRKYREFHRTLLDWGVLEHTR